MIANEIVKLLTSRSRPSDLFLCVSLLVGLDIAKSSLPKGLALMILARTFSEVVLKKEVNVKDRIRSLELLEELFWSTKLFDKCTKSDIEDLIADTLMVREYQCNQKSRDKAIQILKAHYRITDGDLDNYVQKRFRKPKFFWFL